MTARDLTRAALLLPLALLAFVVYAVALTIWWPLDAALRWVWE